MGREGTMQPQITRRQALRRGAALGGALLWTAPTVQTLGMGRAMAASPSGVCILYCVKYDVGSGWTEVGNGQGNCLVCPSVAVDGLPPDIGQASVSGDAETVLNVTLPPGCSVFDSTATGTPDELAGPSGVWVKCGSSRHGQACHFQSVDPGATAFSVSPCANGKGISHFELVIECCP